MAQATILASGTTAATSTDIVLAAGAQRQRVGIDGGEQCVGTRRLWVADQVNEQPTKPA